MSNVPFRRMTTAPADDVPTNSLAGYLPHAKSGSILLIALRNRQAGHKITADWRERFQHYMAAVLCVHSWPFSSELHLSTFLQIEALLMRRRVRAVARGLRAVARRMAKFWVSTGSGPAAKRVDRPDADRKPHDD